MLSKLTFPSRQVVHITIKCGFEIDPFSLKKDRMVEGEGFLESKKQNLLFDPKMRRFLQANNKFTDCVPL